MNIYRGEVAGKDIKYSSRGRWRS